MERCAYSEGSTTEHLVGNGIQLAAPSAETQAALASLPALVPVCSGRMGCVWCRIFTEMHPFKLEMATESQPHHYFRLQGTWLGKVSYSVHMEPPSRQDKILEVIISAIHRCIHICTCHRPTYHIDTSDLTVICHGKWCRRWGSHTWECCPPNVTQLELYLYDLGVFDLTPGHLQPCL